MLFDCFIVVVFFSSSHALGPEPTDRGLGRPERHTGMPGGGVPQVLELLDEEGRPVAHLERQARRHCAGKHLQDAHEAHDTGAHQRGLRILHVLSQEFPRAHRRTH